MYNLNWQSDFILDGCFAQMALVFLLGKLQIMIYIAFTIAGIRAEAEFLRSLLSGPEQTHCLVLLWQCHRGAGHPPAQPSVGNTPAATQSLDAVSEASQRMENEENFLFAYSYCL